MLDVTRAKLSKVIDKGLHLARKGGRPLLREHQPTSSHQVATACTQDWAVLTEESENVSGWEVLAETRLQSDGGNAPEVLLNVEADDSVESFMQTSVHASSGDHEAASEGHVEEKLETAGRHEAAVELIAQRFRDELAALKEHEAKLQKSQKAMSAESRELQKQVSVLKQDAGLSQWKASQREAELKRQLEQKEASSQKLREELVALQFREEASHLEVERSAKCQIEEHKAASQKFQDELAALKEQLAESEKSQNTMSAVSRELQQKASVLKESAEASQLKASQCEAELKRQVTQQKASSQSLREELVALQLREEASRLEVERSAKCQIEEHKAASQKFQDELAALKEHEAELQKSQKTMSAESRELLKKVSGLELRADASQWKAAQREAELKRQIKQQEASSQKLREDYAALQLVEEASRLRVERLAKCQIAEHRAASQKLLTELAELKLREESRLEAEERSAALSESLPEDLECPICRDLLFDPVTITTRPGRDAQRCGHTFCRSCIKLQFVQQWSCPVCRASANGVVDNVLVRGMISDRFPEKLAQRAQEHRELHPDQQRIDHRNSMAYTFREFIECYGERRGLEYWSSSAQPPH